MASTLFLIDAHALCYRSYFAIKNLSTSYGQATNAVFGFTNTLRKILKDFHPDYMAVCFDAGKKTRRQERYAEYKIHRPAMPDDLVSQLPLIKEVVAAFKLPMFELEGFEADDVIATIAAKTSQRDLNVVIVSGDKDMLQLLNEKTRMFNVRKEEFVDQEIAKKIFGIDPKHITDYLGLAGDQSDNIPGVMGVGEVTAKDLINEFGTIENIYTHIDKVKSAKVKEKLMQDKDKAFFSKELAILDKDVPIKFDLNGLKVLAPDGNRLFELFQKLEFRRFAEEYAAGEAKAPEMTALSQKTFSKPEDIKVLCAQITEKKEFSFLVDSPQSDEGTLFGGLALYTGGKEAIYVASDNVHYLKEIFEDKNLLKVSHDIKEAMKFLSRQGITLEGKAFDVMLAGYLLAPSSGAYDIESMAWQHLKASNISAENMAQRIKVVFDAYVFLKKELKDKALLKLFEEVEMPLAHVLFLMESEGVAIDEDLLQKLSKECERKIESLVLELYRLAGMEFNLNSPKQLSQVLFEKLKLPAIKKTKTGLSTDEGVLMKLAAKHPLPALILDYRQLTKLKSTYIDSLPKLINPETRRVHASFNQVGTETGRLSSNNPNLQNIPIRTELGREIRKAFIAHGKDYMIISADYSQIELRILAHLSQDKNLINAFKKDQDIHSYTAALIFDVAENKVTSDMRNSAKRVNFGIIYGMSAFGLAKDLEISQGEAQEFIDKYFLRYPSVKKFMDAEIKKGEEQGFVLTLLKRRRYLPDLKSDNVNVRQLAQRQAINTPVQGSAADLIKLAMINIQQEIEKKALKSRMIITVHDELVFDVLEKEKDAMVGLIRDRMENTMALSVPVKTTMKTGKNWLEMKEV